MHNARTAATVALRAPIPPTPEMLERLRQWKARSVPTPRGIIKAKGRATGNTFPRENGNTFPKARADNTAPNKPTERQLDSELFAEHRRPMMISRKDPRFTPAAIRALTQSIKRRVSKAGALFVPKGGRDHNISLLLRILRRKLSRLKLRIQSTLLRVSAQISGKVPAKAHEMSSIPAMLAFCRRVADALKWEAAEAEAYEPGTGGQWALEEQASVEELWAIQLPELSPLDLSILDVWREETASVVCLDSIRKSAAGWRNSYSHGDLEDFMLYDGPQRNSIQQYSRGLPSNWDAYSCWVSTREDIC